jgi:hypothetical protein
MGASMNLAETRDIDRPDLLPRVLAVLGLVLHVVLGFIIVFGAGLVAPLSGVLLLSAAWLALLMLGIRWWTSAPRLVLLVPIIAFVFGSLVLWIGGRYLDWQV